jgi:hypothetical protein
VHHGGHPSAQVFPSVHGGRHAPPRDVPSFAYGGGTFPQGHGGYPRVATLVAPSLAFAGLSLHPSLPQEDHRSSSGSVITMSFSSPGRGLPCPLLYHPWTRMTISVGTATNMGWSMGLLKRILTHHSSWPTIFSDSSPSSLSMGHPFKGFASYFMALALSSFCRTLTNISHIFSAGRQLLRSLHGFNSLSSPVICLLLLSLDPKLPLRFHLFLSSFEFGSQASLRIPLVSLFF